MAEAVDNGVRTMDDALRDKKVRDGLTSLIGSMGFEVEDLFVVGYGMDMAHSFRELPYVGVVEV